MEEPRCRVALLYDADNVPAMHARRALSAAREEGEVVAFRAYGRERALNSQDWNSAAHELGAKLIPCPTECHGKNAADLLIAIDAMDFLAAGLCDSFAIASNDSDFLALARRLRASSKRVIGIGTSKHTDAYRNEFDAFVVLEGQIPDATVGETGLEGKDELTSFLSSCLYDASGGDLRCSLSSFSHQVRKRNPSLDPKRYGYPTLKKLVLATSAFDIRQVKGGDFVIQAKMRR